MKNPFLTKLVGLRCNCRIDAAVGEFERLSVLVCFYFLFHGRPTSEKISVVARSGWPRIFHASKSG